MIGGMNLVDVKKTMMLETQAYYLPALDAPWSDKLTEAISLITVSMSFTEDKSNGTHPNILVDSNAHEQASSHRLI